MAPISIWMAAKPRLAGGCVAWLQCPQSVLDETTTFKQENSLVIGHSGSL